LIALAATIYMETMGKAGLQEVAIQNAQKTAYAAKRISEIDGFEIAFSAPKFNEFVVRASEPATEILEKIRSAAGIIGGLALSKYYPERRNEFLVCVTETRPRSEIDGLVAALAA
ncbi:MAG: glycine dehydrogenase, partial [Blastocatellia bacterium]|nr:glycine dehydrogenase [Blastocatellia bacterium]